MLRSAGRALERALADAGNSGVSRLPAAGSRISFRSTITATAAQTINTGHSNRTFPPDTVISQFHGWTSTDSPARCASRPFSTDSEL